MARTKLPILLLSAGAANLNRCRYIVLWISRRLENERATEGSFFIEGSIPTVVAGEPFISLQVCAAIHDFGASGAVSVHAEAARNGVNEGWRALFRDWREALSNRAEGAQANITGLIERTNAWLDATLHPLERRRLQSYLRQLRHSRSHKKSKTRPTAQLRISKKLYDQVVSGVPRGKHATFIANLLKWASSSQEGRAAALAATEIAAA